jgi:RimJ/RimL family protein N-acetyltransferase
MRRFVRLLPPDSPERLRLAAGWLADPDNGRWLDLGQRSPPALEGWLKIALQRGHTALRLFTDDDEARPIGVVGFSDIHPRFHTATAWIVLGDKRYARRGYGTRAVLRLLTMGFSDMGLRSVQTWIVEHNVSCEIARRVGFLEVGRQRQCHCIDGRVYDRLLFDMLPGEQREIAP